jgi:cytochrome c-type biogenesis protein CcmH
MKVAPMKLSSLKRWLPVAVLGAVVVVALAIGGVRSAGSHSASARVSHIASEVRCPTCEGLSAEQSDAPASQAIRALIRDKVDAGYSDKQILAYLVDRYGQDILLRPRSNGVSALVWALPVAGLVLALAGLVFAFARWRRRRGAPGLADEDRLLVAAARPFDPAETARQEEVNFLLVSLADLEREQEAGDIEEADYLSLRDDYTARAAALLRGDRLVPADGGGTRSRLRTGLAVAGVVALAGLAGVGVAHTAGERLPGAAAAGSITDTGPSEKLSRASALAGQGRLLDAIKLYDEVLRDDPANAQALAYRGWLLRLAGKSGNSAALVDKGLASIDQAIAANPGYPDAHFFKGEILLRDKNQPAAAIPEFQAFLARGGAPDMSALVTGELQAAQQAAGQTPSK